MSSETDLTHSFHMTSRDHAPLIFFDDSPFLGVYNNTVSVTLVANFAQAGPNNEARQNTATVAYLRTSLQGAIALHAALDRALLVAMPTEHRKN